MTVWPLVAAMLAACSAAAGTAAFRMRTDGGLSERVLSMAGPGSHRAESLWGRLGRSRAGAIVGRREALGRLAATARSKLSADEIVGIKVAGAGGGLACAAAAAVAPPLVVISPLIAVAGFRLPDLLLARAARRRRMLADEALPELLDLLAAASRAGLGAQVAVRRAAAALEGPLGDELRTFLRAVDLGARWRDELGGLADRLDLPDLRRAVHAMTRTEALGSSLTETLRELAEDVRDERRSRAAELARKAPVKMLFPLVFMVLPAFLLLTVVPVLISTLRSIR
jgi:tight adherence protein C